MAYFIPNGKKYCFTKHCKTVYIYAEKFSARSCQFFIFCFAFLPSLSIPQSWEKNTLAFPLVWLIGWRTFCSFLAWAKTRKMRPGKNFFCKLIIFCVQALSKVLRSFPPDTWYHSQADYYWTHCSANWRWLLVVFSH